MKDLVLFDLDGTLALIDHRLHFIAGPDKKHREFHAACSDDEPNEPVVATWHAHKAVGCNLWIVSGRSDAVKNKTLAWLASHHLRPDKLLMRPERDHQPDVSLKRSWLREGRIPRERVLCVYEDQTPVVRMWRSEGLTCFQVAPGKFA